MNWASERQEHREIPDGKDQVEHLIIQGKIGAATTMAAKTTIKKIKLQQHLMFATDDSIPRTDVYGQPIKVLLEQY